MPYDVSDMLGELRSSRRHVLKHIKTLEQSHFDWKPYPECKSLRDTLVHLVVDDRAAMSAVERINNNATVLPEEPQVRPPSGWRTHIPVRSHSRALLHAAYPHARRPR